MGNMNDLTRVKPIKGQINFDERKDTPFYMRSDSVDLCNPLIGVTLDGVKNADKIRVNKSDYSPSVGRDKN